MLVRYRDLVGDPHGVVRRIADATRIEASDADVRRAVESAGGARFNVGVTGRGASLHPEAEHEILSLLQWYPEAAGDPYVADMLARAASSRSTAPRAHAAFLRDAA